MSHEKDIHHGKAIVPYAPHHAAPTLNWPPHISFAPGWVLPGGRRTQSRDVAETVAENINLYLTP